jgi:transcriptional regulator with PAS, ATPase and Fis domain
LKGINETRQGLVSTDINYKFVSAKKIECSYMDIQDIKQRFGIIGNDTELTRAIEVAIQVAPTDLSVLITGESGVGKESFPQIIHNYSHRKHGKYIAVNCGAIPEGTIDSELFGHEKGSFTGAMNDRKGYFEVTDGGTLFLDEIGELPLSTQVRLLRVLETGEFIRVGSSLVQKTDVRVIAATNVDLTLAIRENKFREDLYYRLNTVPIKISPLRKRGEDIVLLFRKFANDFAERYKMPPIRLTEEAQKVLIAYRWPGNVRQLKNITEQISIIETEREISAEKLFHYIPADNVATLPVIYDKSAEGKTFHSEREILYQVLFDLRRDMYELSKKVDVLSAEKSKTNETAAPMIRKIYHDDEEEYKPAQAEFSSPVVMKGENNIEDTEEFVEESLSLADKEIEMIIKCLEKHNGKRKMAAQELGISERTLYRKIKEYNIESK